ncbi:hypothetical protein CJ030_MR7G015261, partial [Morella rubra]
VGLILSKGHSRVPIYSGSSRNIIGLILVKNLIKFRREDETPIKDLVVRRIPRIHDCLPLYDLLNEFQKRHSHMAVVIKRIEHQQQLAQNHERLKISVASPSICSSDRSETQFPLLDNASLRNSVQISPQSKKWHRGEGNILKGGLESLPHFDVEVVGIITLEDVIEELLQPTRISSMAGRPPLLEEELVLTPAIARIKINMLSSKPSPSRSPAAPSGSRFQRQTSVASPVSLYDDTSLSSCNHSPILRSPISAYLQSPLMSPTLSPSPKRSVPNYPPMFAGGARYSPSLQKHKLCIGKPTAYEAMKTLICSFRLPPLNLAKPPPWKPKSPILHPTTTPTLKHRLSSLKRVANAKGFTGAPAASIKDSTKNSNKTNNDDDDDDDDELPRVVIDRIIARILAFVGVPMGAGLALLYIFGFVKEQHIWDFPLWIPFLTTLLTFGASTMGIAYGALSTSWDPERKGSVLGLEEAQKNWVQVWREED